MKNYENYWHLLRHYVVEAMCQAESNEEIFYYGLVLESMKEIENEEREQNE